MFSESKNQEITNHTASETNRNQRLSIRTRAMSGVLGVSLFVSLASAACEAKVNTQTPTVKTEQSLVTEKPKKNITIEVDSQIADVSPISGRSTQDDVEILNQLLEKVPNLGNFNIVLTSGDHELETDYTNIFVNREHVTPQGLKYEAAHLLVHAMDPNIDKEFKALLSDEDNAQLINYRFQALEDPTWGREYPSFDKIFSSTKKGVSFTAITPQQTTEQTQMLTNLYADSVWVLGKKRPFEKGFQPFLKYLEEINKYQDSQKHIGDISIGDFLEAHNEEVSNLTENNTLLAYAFSKLKGKNFVINEENLKWLEESPGGQVFTDGNEGTAWKVASILADTILLEAFINEDPEVMALIPESELPTIADIVKHRQAYADSEKFAELGAATIAGEKTTSYSPFAQKLEEIASR